ncbi:MAG: hypothetical protein M0Q96_04890 [Candidatus Omnitrophica bacterium]|jgi:hypothetical protein|nr:hypothetical protein [Candidatus Omnitrophota bacterium]
MNKAVYILLVCFLFAGCERPNLYSYPKDREIVIDGKYSEWGDYVSYYSEKEKLVVNLANDKDYLYICLVSRSRRVETQIMESGLQLWFDADNGQRKLFGIRFPIGMRAMGMPISQKLKKDDRQVYDDNQDALRKDDWGDKEFDKKLETIENLQDKIELTLPNDKKMPGTGKEMLLEEANKFGVEAKLGREKGYFVYELKVPLNITKEHPYAIGIQEDGRIGLGIEVQNSRVERVGGPVARPTGNKDDQPDIPSDAMFGTGSSYSEENIKLWVIINLAMKGV